MLAEVWRGKNLEHRVWIALHNIFCIAVPIAFLTNWSAKYTDIIYLPINLTEKICQNSGYGCMTSAKHSNEGGPAAGSLSLMIRSGGGGSNGTVKCTINIFC